MLLVDVAATPRQESYEYDSNTMVPVADSDLLGSVIEDDQVTLYAEVVGSTSHDTQIGTRQSCTSMRVSSS